MMNLIAAKAYVKSLGLPKDGYVMFCRDLAFGWEQSLPDPSCVMPGVVAIGLSGDVFVSQLGDADRGARSWRREKTR